MFYVAWLKRFCLNERRRPEETRSIFESKENAATFGCSS